MYLKKINLKNKTALVTGAGKGIGRACAIALAEAGASLIIVSRTQKDLDKVSKIIKKFKSKCVSYTCDVTNYNQIKNIINKQKKIKVDNLNLSKAVMTIIIADITMSLDNVLGVAGAAKDYYILLVFGLILSILLMATVATIISKWIKKYRWIGWLGLLAILAVATELIYSDLKIFL